MGRSFISDDRSARSIPTLDGIVIEAVSDLVTQGFAGPADSFVLALDPYPARGQTYTFNASEWDLAR